MPPLVYQTAVSPNEDTQLAHAGSKGIRKPLFRARL